MLQCLLRIIKVIDKSFRLCYNKNTDKNIPTMSVEKNKRSHRVVARGTLCVFVIISLPLEGGGIVEHCEHDDGRSPCLWSACQTPPVAVRRHADAPSPLSASQTFPHIGGELPSGREPNLVLRSTYFKPSPMEKVATARHCRSPLTEEVEYRKI